MPRRGFAGKRCWRRPFGQVEPARPPAAWGSIDQGRLRGIRYLCKNSTLPDRIGGEDQQGRRRMVATFFTRRSVLRSSVALAAAGTIGRPYIANAQAKTAQVWWVQGFFPEEDEAFKTLAASYEKTSGNKLDYSIIPFAPMRQKIISAITSGVVPDLMYATPPEVVPEQAWAGKLVDVTDVIETQKSKFLPAAINSAYFYNA